MNNSMVVTQALPYANGDIHLGHMVEAVQSDIFVRYHRLCGKNALYVCADDTHGTPIELSAMRKKISPEELVTRFHQRHVEDYRAFDIQFDSYHSTNSEENRTYVEQIYQALQSHELIIEKEVSQLYCPHDKRFLPDRFISGTCPRCDAQKQYGDVCEKCGATYDVTELESPQCVICGTTPELKKSTHFFVNLDKRREFLNSYVFEHDVLKTDVQNSVRQWLQQGLREWCISRDAPYFGFRIPGTQDKYFYVWLDAPVGYISSTRKWCDENGVDIANLWGKDAPSDVIHFIGKDIVYFHTLFWPVMLHTAEFKLPSKIFVHGFLSIEGEKMSKTRGTFILARDYAKKVSHPDATEYFRFFMGAKLSDNCEDIDLNSEELCNRINTTLVHNIGNLHHRTFVFCKKQFNSTIPDAGWDEEIERRTREIGKIVCEAFEKTDYKKAVEEIHRLGSIGNKYYQDRAPWESIRTDREKTAQTMVTCANIVKALAVLLKPIVPGITARIESQLGFTFTMNDYPFSLKNTEFGSLKKLVKPIEKSAFDTLMPEHTDASPESQQEQNVIDIERFSSVDLRVATVKEAARIPKSDKLLALQVEDGNGIRQIVAGIGTYYSPESLIDTQVVIVANLKPAKLMGHTSHGMVLAAQSEQGLTLIRPQDVTSSGAKVS